MPNATIDLRELKRELKGGSMPENELPAVSSSNLSPSLARQSPARPLQNDSVGLAAGGFGEGEVREPFLETETAAYPEGFGDASRPPLLAWEAPEFNHSETSVILLLLAGGAIALGGIIALFFKNFLFALLLMISGGLLISYAYRLPRGVQFSVTSRGVKMGRRLYEFGDLESFWILYDPPLFQELILRSKKTFMPVLRAPLGELDPLRLRKVLLGFLREEEQEASLMDILSKHLGF